MEKPLEGLKVIDWATYVAGPTCARVLADWGADVIKVENPIGDALRRAGVNTHLPTLPEENPNFDLCNMGKKSIALNLKSEDGIEILYKLLEQADVFITNTRTKSLIKLGLDYDSLKERFPKLIFAQVLGYGEKGPLKDKPGFDFTAYYARGGMLGTLYEEGTSPLNPVPHFGDNQVAMNLAGGILAALYKKQVTGMGDKVTASLYQAAMFAFNLTITASQSGFHYPISKKAVVNPLLNTYRTKDDRWIQVAAPEYDKVFPIAMKAMGREDLIDDERYNKIANFNGKSSDAVELFVSEFAKRDVDEWVKIFEEYDIPCEKAFLWEEILEDEQAWENGYLHKMHYKTGSVRTLVESPVKFGSVASFEHNRGPILGENNTEILSNLGYSAEKIAEMAGNKTIVEG
nr:CoA transferase [uncultured Bacillus sp.]